MSGGVMLYTLSTCPWCRKAKQFFASHGVSYEFVDVDLLPDDEYETVTHEVYELSGSRAYPIARIGDECVVGYAPEKYAALLGISE